MRCAILITILTLSALASFPAMAQAPKCNPSIVIKAANRLKATGNAQKDMAALLKLQTDISAANIACNGLTFIGKGNRLIRPFDLPDGIYVMALRMESPKLTNATLQAVKGDCLSIVTAALLEARFEAKNCRATIEVMNVDTTNWTITLEPIE